MSWLPSVVFSVVAISTGVLVLLLPETLNRPLAETIEEIETWTTDAPKAELVKHGEKQKSGDVNSNQETPF